MGDENYYNEGNISYPCASWAPILGFLGCASAIVFASKFGRAREEWPTKKRASAAFFPCDVVLVPVPTLNMEAIQERSGRMRNGGRDGRDDCSAPGAKPLDRRMSWRGAGRDAAGYNGV